MSSVSKFGRSMLEKYGWSDGKGLGRDESGMVDPIKVIGNFNANGLGHDAGLEFKNQWWDHVYNKTADNITVGKSEDGSVSITRKEEHKLSQKAVPYVKASLSQYSSFVKAGELENVPKEKDMSLNLSDDELFKICGGRTAHKGARHGITMSAKLARVKQQEIELMEKWQSSKEEQSQEIEGRNEKIRKSKKKKREVVNDKEVEVSDTALLNEPIHNDIGSTQLEDLPKKHKKKKKHREKISFEESSPQERSPKLSKKERKLLAKSEECLGTLEQMDDSLQDENEEEVMRKKPKKKKKKKGGEKENDVETEVVAFESEVVEKKKHKKKKRDRTESFMAEGPLDSNENIEKYELNSEGYNDKCHKKRKKCKREK